LPRARLWLDCWPSLAKAARSRVSLPTFDFLSSCPQPINWLDDCLK
jgi:hypothetical protein